MGAILQNGVPSVRPSVRLSAFHSVQPFCPVPLIPLIVCFVFINAELEQKTMTMMVMMMIKSRIEDRIFFRFGGNIPRRAKSRGSHFWTERSKVTRSDGPIE